MKWILCIVAVFQEEIFRETQCTILFLESRQTFEAAQQKWRPATRLHTKNISRQKPVSNAYISGLYPQSFTRIIRHPVLGKSLPPLNREF